MIHKILITVAVLGTLAVLPIHAQQPIAGQPCGAPGASAIATNGQAVQCQGSPLVWTATGGGNAGQVPGVFSASSDPPMVQNWTVSATGAQSPVVNLIAAPIDTHQIQWRPVGTLTSCQVQLDTSADNVTYTAAGAIASQNCLQANQISVQGILANYVRINVTALAGGGTLNVQYAGRLAPTLTYAPQNQQSFSIGIEFSNVGNNGANASRPALRPFLLTGVAGVHSIFPRTAPASGGPVQCLLYGHVIRGGPPRYQGIVADFPTNQAFNTVLGGTFNAWGVFHDPSAVSVNDGQWMDSFATSIIKFYLPTAGTSGQSTSNIAYNITQLINAGDWINFHQDCTTVGGVVLDTEIQITMSGIAGPQPKYVQWFSDNFTRANESPVCFNGGAGTCWWTKVSTTTNLQVLSNLLTPVTGNQSATYFLNIGNGAESQAVTNPAAPNGSGDQYGDVTIATSASGCGASACNYGVFLRGTTGSGGSGYLVDMTGQAGSSASWVIDKVTNGGFSQLTSGTGNIPVGSILRGEVQGNTITAKVCTVGGVNPSCTTLGSTTDNTYTTGSVGVFLQSDTTVTDAQISAWDAGTLNF